MATISILGLKPSAVILALYEKASPNITSFFTLKHVQNPNNALERAEEIIKSKYSMFGKTTNIRMEFDEIDLGEGSRKLSIVLEDDECYSDEYDKLYGDNAALKAITGMPSSDSILDNSRKKINLIRAAIQQKSMNNPQQPQPPANTDQKQVTTQKPPATTQNLSYLHIGRSFLPSGGAGGFYQRALLGQPYEGPIIYQTFAHHFIYRKGFK